MEVRSLVARLMWLGALACGVIGLIVAFIDRQWKLGVTGWFTGGTLLAVLGLMMLADEYFAARKRVGG